MKRWMSTPFVAAVLALSLLGVAPLAHAEHLTPTNPYPGLEPAPPGSFPFRGVDLYPDLGGTYSVSGSAYIFNFGVVNGGNVAAGPFLLKVTRQTASGTTTVYNQWVPGLAAGQRLTYEVRTSCVGGGLFTFIVDSSNVVAEVFEFNNTRMLNIGGCP